MSDYEMALHTAIREVFSECQQIGWWFYYCQAIRRYWLKIAGFTHKITQNDEGAMWRRRYVQNRRRYVQAAHGYVHFI